MTSVQQSKLWLIDLSSSIPCEFIDISVSDYYGYPLDDNALSVTLSNVAVRSQSERTIPYVNKLMTISDDLIVLLFDTTHLDYYKQTIKESSVCTSREPKQQSF